MTKKHYEAFARWAVTEGLTDDQMVSLADLLEQLDDTQRFNRTRFLSACSQTGVEL